MATFTSFSSVDMTDSIFTENVTLRTLTANDIFLKATGTAREWQLSGNGISSHFDTPSQSTVVDTGFISSTRYFVNSQPVFQSLDIPNIGAPLLWNAFHLGDNAAMFGLLLLGDDHVNGSAQNDSIGGYDGDDTVSGFAGLDRVTGGTGADTLDGGQGDDRVLGGRGADLVAGGADNDTLTGGTGRDEFYFANKGLANADNIADFTEVADKIVLDLDFFPALLAAGNLPTAMFKAATDITVSAGSVDANDRILYDTDSGRLYYDPDGSGAGDRVLVATVFDSPGHHPLLAAGDFRIVA